MKNILVPIDFSDCSIKALQYAIGLCKITDGKLVILHSVQVPVLTEKGTETGEEIREEIDEKFNQVKKQVPLLEDVNYNFELNFEFVLSSIRKVVKKNYIDLIVMGTKGATGAKEIFLGSNTYETIKEVKCPVIAIPEKSESFQLGSIAFASDYKRIKDYADLDLMIELAKLRNSEIHILHIGEEKNMTREELEVGRSQDQCFKPVRHSYHYINGTDIAKEINSYLKSNGIKLLGVYARQHSLTDKLFHQSLTQEMVFHPEVPLLVIPETSPFE